MQTGKKIKVLRAMRGLTQEELAEKINKTRALVSSIEQTGKVNHHTLIAILKALQISPEEFEVFDVRKPDKKSTKLYPTPNDEDISVLKERLENYQKENSLLKELVESQKKVITVLEKKKGK